MEKSTSVIETPPINRHLIAWIVILFGLTGLGVLYLILTGVEQSKDFSPAIILIAYAPSLAALCVAGFLSGAGSIRSLLRPIGKWRVGIQWYALVLIGPLVLVLLANAISLALGGAPPQQWVTFSALGSAIGPLLAGSLGVLIGPLVLVLLANAISLALGGAPPQQWVTFSALGSAIGPLLAGSLGEEIGWRGFAQPLLQKRYSVLGASVIIGILWATWHLWPVIAPGGLSSTTFLDVIQTYVRLISTAIIYGWIYNRTRGSLLLVMLAHAGHNIAVDLLPPATEGAALLLAFLYLAAAIAVIWATKAQILSRPKNL